MLSKFFLEIFQHNLTCRVNEDCYDDPYFGWISRATLMDSGVAGAAAVVGNEVDDGNDDD